MLEVRILPKSVVRKFPSFATQSITYSLTEKIEEHSDFRSGPTMTGIERVEFDRRQRPVGKDTH